MKKLHLGVCIFYWLLWGVGLLSLALSFFVYKNDNEFLFYNIVLPYGKAVLIASVLPIELAVSIATVVRKRKEKRSIKSDIILSVITAVLWYLYLSAFIYVTGI